MPFLQGRRFHCGGFVIVFLRPPLRSELKKVVHWMSEILLAAEIAFRCLDGCMPQQELNLLQLATATVAQFRAGSPQVMRRNMLQARSLAATLDYLPHHFFVAFHFDDNHRYWWLYYGWLAIAGVVMSIMAVVEKVKRKVERPQKV
jgi:hypothetical protein